MMMLSLQRYNITIVYKRGKELYLADTLSRAYTKCDEQSESMEEEFEVLEMSQVSSQRMTELKEVTATDKTCQALIKVISQGWPEYYKSTPPLVRPYFACRLR